MGELEKMGTKYRIALRFVLYFHTLNCIVPKCILLFPLCPNAPYCPCCAQMHPTSQGESAGLIGLTLKYVVQCVMLRSVLSVCYRIARDERFQRLPCMHKGTYADDCLVNRVTQVLYDDEIMDSNSSAFHFCIWPSVPALWSYLISGRNLGGAGCILTLDILT
jgi:hypothetical protein